MADQEVALRIKANAEEAVKTVGNIKKELREAQRDAVAIGAAFGETSKEAIEAAKRVAALKDQIQDTNERIALFDPGAKFAAVGNALRTVAGGFSALTGAVALFGVQSEEVEKTLLKVQAALALTEGLNTIADAGQAFDKLKIAATSALSGIRKGLLATGIGALVVALGTIVAYWDDITEAINGVSAEQEDLNEKVAKNLELEQKKLDEVSSQDNVLRLQGKSEQEILKLKVAQVDATIKATQATIEQQKITTRLQVDAARRNQEYLTGFLDFITIPVRKVAEFASSVINGLINVLNKIPGVDIDFKLNGEKIDDVNKYLAGFIFDPEETAKEGQATIEESEKALLKLQDQRAGFLLNIQNINNQAADKAREEKKKRDEQALQDELEIQKKREALGLATATGGATEAALAARKAARDAELAIDAEAENKRVELIGRAQATINGIQQQGIDKQKEAAAIAVQRQQIEQQAYLGIADALGALGQAIGQQTAAGKALGIAQAVINTWIGVTEVLRAKSLLPEPLGTIAKVANIATIVAAGFSAVRNIVKVNVPGGGGGGAPTGSLTAPTIPQNAITGQTTLDANSLNQIGNATTRAFVVESDVANNMERVTRLNRAARLG